MNAIEFGEDRLGNKGDEFYEMLMKAHEGLSEKQSHELNIRLVLIMANRIGSVEELRSLLEAASKHESRS